MAENPNHSPSALPRIKNQKSNSTILDHIEYKCPNKIFLSILNVLPSGGKNYNGEYPDKIFGNNL